MSFKEFIRKYQGLILGVGLGLVIGILFLTIGFFATLLLIVLCGIGALIGGIPALRHGLAEKIKDFFIKIFTKR